jgi:Transcriptional regulatory protein, C terminal
MKKTILYIVLPFMLLGVGFASFTAFLSEKGAPSVKIAFSQKINLALRQTAHRLLQQVGDSTSRIAPIKQTADNSYFVELKHGFTYDSLPVFLQRSFMEHGIEGNYDVAVLDCGGKGLILGYASFNLNKENGEGVPCSGRNQTGGCINFSVTFTDTPPVLAKNNWIGFILGGFSFLGLAAGAYFLFLKTKKNNEVTVENKILTDETHLIPIGNSVFNTRNQTFTTGDMVQKLTFQESKLLNLFCQHQNELLDRDFILKSVWDDEGVLVTRSVDVFISRLRKILKEDAVLKITNVHSRGYRFETVA